MRIDGNGGFAGGWPFFDPQGARRTIAGFGRINRLHKDRSWQDRFGAADPAGIERPAGQWNRVECVCQGNTVAILINGTLVNRAADVFPASGRILLQCECSDMFFRCVELRPVAPAVDSP